MHSTKSLKFKNEIHLNIDPTSCVNYSKYYLNTLHIIQILFFKKAKSCQIHLQKVVTFQDQNRFYQQMCELKCMRPTFNNPLTSISMLLMYAR